MASIERLIVRTETIEDTSNRWRITIEYALRMRYWEAGNWFSEVVEIYAGRSQQVHSATLLRRLRCNAWKLDESTSLADSNFYLLERSVPPQEVSLPHPQDIFVLACVNPMLPEKTGTSWILAEPVEGTAP